MSEYQFYAFQAIDQPLSHADRAELRALSSRASISSTRFTNTYHWGNFKGDPAKLMARWFDLHLYLTNWGSRRLMIRWPLRFLDPLDVEPFLRETEGVTLDRAGDVLILDIFREIEDAEFIGGEDEDESDGTRLDTLAPLRADVLAGDLRLFYLIWLIAVQDDAFPPDACEPLAGLGPISGALDSFAELFELDRDLIGAAAERSLPIAAAPDPATVRRIIEAMSTREKTDLLVRVAAGDPIAALTLQATIRERAASKIPASSTPPRTVAELRARAEAVRLQRERVAAAAAEAARRKAFEEAETARQARLTAIERRGEGVWREIDDEIARRHATGYERAATLLIDLKAVAEKRGTREAFDRRLDQIRRQHAAKGRLIERLRVLDD